MEDDESVGTVASAALPGTTLPVREHNGDNRTPHPEPSGNPVHFFGPVVKDKSTTVTLYEPEQLRDNDILEPLRTLINEAFRWSHTKYNTMADHVERLSYTWQYTAQLGSDEGTFAFIITNDDNGQPIATLAAHRYVAPVLIVEPAGKGSAFRRLQLPADADEADDVWELKLMAVLPGLHGGGLASYLMKLTEDEIRRRSSQVLNSGSNGAARPRKLFLVLTTIKESNEGFYARRGFTLDYETEQEKGYSGSPNGFRVVHMSKTLDL
jgi:GNAT superfamily N-acetyltransferase